jgi:hypothetical protein
MRVVKKVILVVERRGVVEVRVISSFASLDGASAHVCFPRTLSNLACSFGRIFECTSFVIASRSSWSSAFRFVVESFGLAKSRSPEKPRAARSIDMSMSSENRSMRRNTLERDVPPLKRSSGREYLSAERDVGESKRPKNLFPSRWQWNYGGWRFPRKKVAGQPRCSGAFAPDHSFLSQNIDYGSD